MEENFVFTDRVSTGVKNLDLILEGGLIKNSTNMVVGPPGSGKTIFGVQFLVDGAAKGEPGVFVTFQENRRKLRTEMMRFGWDLTELRREKKIIVLEYSPEQVDSLVKKGSGSLRDEIEEIKAKRIVIDSLNSLGLLYQEGLAKRKLLLGLFTRLREWECTSVLINEINYPDEIMPLTTSGFEAEFEVDGIIKLSMLKEGNERKERKRYLEIMKMRATIHPIQMIPMKITKKGIALEAQESLTGQQ